MTVQQKQIYFVTGTDTGVGKTTVCCYLLEAMAKQGLKTLALKPVASGAERHGRLYKNDDAIQLQKASTERQRYDKVNPYCFKDPVSPHIAAKRAKKSVSINDLVKSCQSTIKRNADYILIEGAGGWSVPINDHETLGDFATKLGHPVIIVVGMRLGCLNHTFLTVSEIERAGLPIVGWFANCIDPDFMCLEENIETLKKWIPYPMLGRLKYDKQLESGEQDAPDSTQGFENDSEPDVKESSEEQL